MRECFEGGKGRAAFEVLQGFPEHQSVHIDRTVG